jgi:ribosomal protein L7/L12
MPATLDQIAAHAYQRFVARGGEHGHDVEDWLAAERELATYEVVLLSPGASMIELLRELRDVTGLELRELKDRIERGPLTIQREAPFAEAEALRERLQAIGARLAVRPNP